MQERAAPCARRTEEDHAGHPVWRYPISMMAEREGFEPSERLPVHVISSHADSAALASLRLFDLLRMCVGRSTATRVAQALSSGGERGIRTPGAVACPAVFETAPFNRSGISPHIPLINRPEPIHSLKPETQDLHANRPTGASGLTRLPHFREELKQQLLASALQDPA